MFTQGQWWSIFTMHALQEEQWCARAGLIALHLKHMDPHPDGSTGRALGGTAPGLDSMVRACDSRARTATPLKSRAWDAPARDARPKEGDSTCRVTTMEEKMINAHTQPAANNPHGSVLSHTACASLVPHPPLPPRRPPPRQGRRAAHQGLVGPLRRGVAGGAGGGAVMELVVLGDRRCVIFHGFLPRAPQVQAPSDPEIGRWRARLQAAGRTTTIWRAAGAHAASWCVCARSRKARTSPKQTNNRG